MLRLTHVHLRVADLARSADFYIRQLGFVAGVQTPAEVALSVQKGGPVVLKLTEDRSATAAPGGAAGLFHSALLLPSRAALASWLRRSVAAGVEFDGFADHGVSEAIYLSDPDGNGLEFYADRPRESWPRNGSEIAMYTRALDMRGLMQEPESPGAPQLAAGSRWGHLHLRVTDLERSQAFYANALGLSVTQSSYPGARFMAADGYHHHVGLNTWGGVSQPQPKGALGLVSAKFSRDGVSSTESLHDPDGIEITVEQRSNL